MDFLHGLDTGVQKPIIITKIERKYIGGFIFGSIPPSEQTQNILPRGQYFIYYLLGERSGGGEREGIHTKDFFLFLLRLNTELLHLLKPILLLAAVCYMVTAGELAQEQVSTICLALTRCPFHLDKKLTATWPPSSCHNIKPLFSNAAVTFHRYSNRHCIPREKL